MVDILAFGAHPDDIEFGCGGILAKAHSQGHSILLVDLTIGEKATNGTPELRHEEALAAAHVIGAKRLILDFADCGVDDTYEGRLKLVKVIREHRPRLILAPSWSEVLNHPDHIACSKLARSACRYARFKQILPELPIHRVEGLLHYLSPADKNIHFIVDVSDHVDTWKRMMECHQSQLKTNPYMDWVLNAAKHLGGMIGRAYAQGLSAYNPVEIDDVLSVSRGTREL